MSRRNQSTLACLVRQPIAAAMMLGGLGSAPLSATAATIVVDSTADPGDASACTLRQAIVSMNTGALAGNCANTGAAFGSNDTIDFSDGLFSSGTATITLTDAYTIPDKISQKPIYAGLYITKNDLAIDAGTGRNVTIERPATAQHKFRVLYAYLTGGHLSMSGLTVQNGYAAYEQQLNKYTLGAFDAAGGGMFLSRGQFTLDHCTIRNNRVYDKTAQGAVGAGLAVAYGSTAYIRSSLVTGNIAGGASGIGGGIFLAKSAATIVDSTISGNVSDGTHGGAALGSTALTNAFAGLVHGDLNIVNSTISGNVSGGAIDGGSAIRAFSPGRVMIANSTLACNDAPVPSGGYPIAAVYLAFPSTATRLTAFSSIFADTSNSRCTTHTSTELASYVPSLRTASPITLAGDHNVVISSSAINSSVPFPADTIFGDPLLGPLQNNGGPTPTHALTHPPAGVNPALDKGSNPGGLSFDQRGADMARSVGAAPDIGAYEDQTSHLCGAAWGQSFTSMSPSTPNLCSSGAYLYGGVVAGTGPWSWICAANADPSNTEFCGARVLANASLTIDNAGGGTISSAVFGQPLLLKAVVGSASATPTGTVTFADVTGGGFIPLCVNVALSGGETACDTTNSPIDTGARQLEAIYNGSGTFGPATSAPGAVQINPAATTTSISSQTPNPVTVGVPFTVVAQVAAKSPSVATPAGSVEIDDQTDGLSCTYDLSAATPGCALTPVSVGTHDLLVTYLASTGMNSSSAANTETVSAVATSTALSATPGSLVFGQSTNLQATITFAGGLTPGGTVVFCDGGSAGDPTFCASGTVLCAAAALSATSPFTAACPTSTLSIGTHALSAHYVGDARFAASTSTPALSASVSQAATTTQLSLLPSTIIALGGSVTATAGVSVTSPGAGTPSGQIQVSNVGSGTADACTIHLPAETSCTLTPTSAGAQTIRADYSGDGDFTPSSSATSSLTVNKAATTTSMSLSASAITFGGTVKVTANVATGVPSVIAIPSGAIAVSDGGSGSGDACTITLPAASCILTPSGAGLKGITASYAGDGNFSTSNSGIASLTVGKAATTTSVSVPPGAITLGDSVPVTVTIASGVSPSFAAPGGSISVNDGGVGGGDSCTITLPATSCTLTPTSMGSKAITANYSGDNDFGASSGAGALTVDALPQPQLGLVITDDHYGYVRYGDTLQYKIVLTNSGTGAATGIAMNATPSVNFNGATMQWQCAPSNGATCTSSSSGSVLADTVMLPANSSLTWTLSITVPAGASGDSVELDASAGGSAASDSSALVVFRDGFD